MMQQLYGLFLCLCILPSLVFGAIERVIYITLDGVRWQDLYETKEYFPLIWEKHKSNIIFYGAPNSSTEMHVASIPVSLPSYQSQTSGVVQPCEGNFCGRITEPTFLENLVNQYHLSKKDVATFSSWDKIGDSVESVQGTTYSNTGNFRVTEPDSDNEDSYMYHINQLQEEDHPDHVDVRFDKYTYVHALHYLMKFKPRFLWLALNDADDLAHANLLEDYHETLITYDQSIDYLLTSLKTLGLYEKTMVIITTDHGRGEGDEWVDHGPHIAGSERTWAMVINGELKPDSVEGGLEHYSTLSIKPTIEAVFK